MKTQIIADTPRGVDVDCYHGNAFVGCARLHLDQEPIAVKASPLLKKYIDEDPERLARIVADVEASRAQS
jgi:hypothetical protein